MVWICAYREWALEIYDQVKNEITCNLITSKEQFNETKFNENDVIFFIGWSWIISDNIIQTHTCICLHPSPLPKYRGGSPLQHQIINGESLSAVTFFKMTNKLDAGNILYQEYFSLKGNLKDIFSRIIPLGTSGIFRILNSNVKEQPQDESQATFYKRRKPEDSEILIEDFKKHTAKKIHDKIRALQDPYPNAYIKCKDKKLFIQISQYEK
tara:strand:+ start:3857 stop:4489 length:633 start_codon:yes stop_codon:yes gene_type:complete